MNAIRMLLIQVACAVVLIASPSANAQADLGVADSIVKVCANMGNTSSWGSGSVINVTGQRVYVMTNSHVLSGFALGQDHCLVYPPNHPPIAIDFIHYAGNRDAGDDLAIISGMSNQPPPALEILEGDVQPGMPVDLVGYPGGQAMSVRPAIATDIQFTPAIGNVPHAHFNQFASQGMSGGPVVFNGRLAAVIFATETDRPGCLAVSLSRVRHAIAAVFPRLAEKFRDAQCQGAQCVPMQPQWRPIAPQSQQPQYSVPPEYSAPSTQQAAINPPGGQPMIVAPAAVAPDLSEYVRREELSEFAKRSAVDSQLAGLARRDELGRYVSSDQLGGYARANDVTAAVGNLRTTIDGVLQSQPDSPNWSSAILAIAAELGLGVAIPGGVFGVVGLKLLGSFWRYRQRSREIDAQIASAKPAGGPDAPFDRVRFDRDPPRRSNKRSKTASESRSIEIRDTAPETVTRTQHQVTRVPTVNREAELLHEALMREINAFPKHAPIVERIRSVAKQLMHGDGVRSSGRANPEANTVGVGWQD